MSIGFSSVALQPIWDLNSRTLNALVESNRRPAHELRITLAIQLNDALQKPGEAVFVKLARIPVCLLDAGFSQEGRWLERLRATSVNPVLDQCEFSRMAALQLSQSLYMAAWNMVRAHPVCARIVFGMSEECLRVFRELPSVEPLIEECWSWVQPRWADKPQVWRRLLRTAQQSHLAKVPAVGIRSMLQLLGDLEPATRGACDTGSRRR